MVGAAAQVVGKPCNGQSNDIERTLEAAVYQSEAAERGLAIDGSAGSLARRLETGSFYTPADVAMHFWQEYFRFHRICTLAELRHHLAATTFVEPSAGAGIFLFSLFLEVASRGGTAQDLSNLSFLAVDTNEDALAFIGHQLCGLERQLGLSWSNAELIHGDFLEATLPRGRSVSFIGNPPYVRNGPNSRWKNTYADFLERMLDEPRKAVALIVPLSIAFSRDYRALRQSLRAMPAIRLSNYDNMPDFLFKAGKPGSTNTNQANSQRCSIVFARSFGPEECMATALQRWSSNDREKFLQASPQYEDISRYALDEQFPRPSCDWIMKYLSGPGHEGLTLADLIGKSGSYRFGVGAVARNFIGIRETDGPGVHCCRFASEQQMLCALQILGSSIFYEYWRSTGDGFHVTKRDIDRFPVSNRLLANCLAGLPIASAIWKERRNYQKRKLNSGKEVCSHDFTGCFDFLNAELLSDCAPVDQGGAVLGISPPRQLPLAGLLSTHIPT